MGDRREKMREIVESKEEMDQAVADYVEGEGWEIIESDDTRTVLELGLKGSWFWHLLWFIIVPIIANIGYSLWRRTGNRPKRKVIRVKNTE